ncbi:hypothetical protein MVES_000948 [Malassezia vespertilionis]|uniref:AP-2 complex subunit alpha n=2 Tax=Malassezia vespertilionis TaxID=2020962 RepID=A0A2N1JDQ8_9BASI|nr:hypothetical protein MVES_000948 [Malassezia vespertilionis]
MNEYPDIVRLATVSIKKDLADMSEVNTCLALHVVANIASEEMVEALSEHVLVLLVSRTSPVCVQKKAALALLRLHQKGPLPVNVAEWSARLSDLIRVTHLGVAQCVTTLLIELVKNTPDAYMDCYYAAVDQMYSIVIEDDYKEIYLYHDIPVPWLQVNLLRLLQLYEPTREKSAISKLYKVLDAIFALAQRNSALVPQRSAAYAVLFEAIRLAMHLNPASTTTARSTALLGKLIHSRETNVRYLSLKTLTDLARCTENLTPLQMYRDSIFAALSDRDISVRRRALDLLYTMTDAHLAQDMVLDLFECLPAAEPAMREEIALKISLLAERFAVEKNWYIDTMLYLFNSFGDNVGELVWYNFLTYVMAQPTIQHHTIEKVFEYLVQDSCHELLVKVGSYLVGELSNLIVDEDGASPHEQLDVLHARAELCSPSTRSFLLATYLKLVNLYPLLSDRVLELMRPCQYVSNTELKQRACEYVALLEKKDSTFLDSACRQMTVLAYGLMPGPDPVQRYDVDELCDTSKDSPEKDLPDMSDISIRRSLPDMKATFRDHGNLTPSRPFSAVIEHRNTLHLFSSPPKPEDQSVSTPARTSSPAFDTVTKPVHVPNTPNTGVLYRRNNISVSFSRVHSLVVLHFEMLAVVDGTVHTVTLQGPNDQDTTPGATVHAPFPVRLSRGKPAQVTIQMGPEMCANTLLISMTIDSELHSLRIPLPVMIMQEVKPVTLNTPEFFQRWKAIGSNAGLEVQSVFPIPRYMDRTSQAHFMELLKHLGFGILHSVDPWPENIVAAGVYSTQADGPVGCLLRLEPNAELKLARLTVRTTTARISQTLSCVIKTQLSET